MRETEAEVAERLPDQLPAFRSGVDDLQTGLDWLIEHAGNDFTVPGAVAFHLLMLCGTVCGAHQSLRGALSAQARLAEGDTERSFLEAKLVTTRFYNESILPRAAGFLSSMQAGAEAVMALTEEQFEPVPLA